MNLKPQSLGADQIFFLNKKSKRKIKVFASVLFQKLVLFACAFGHISSFQVIIDIFVADFSDSCNL